MESWESVLKRDVNEITDAGVSEWAKLVNQLGSAEEEHVAEWIHTYKCEIKQLQTILSNELIEKRDILINEIELLLKKSQKLCKELEIEMPNFGCKNLGLYGEHKELKIKVEKLQQMRDVRMEEVKALLKEQNDLCRTLEHKQLEIPIGASLPSASEVNNLTQYIRDLEEEKFERTEKFVKLKFECLNLAERLNCRPKRSFERSVIYGNDISFVVSKSNLTQLESFHHNLTSRFNTLSENICSMQQRVKDLWIILKEDSAYCEGFMNKHQEVNNETLLAFESEISRCEAKIKEEKWTLIERTRSEIWNLWEKCLYSHDERNNFEFINDDFYSEDLLKLHIFELQKLKKYYDENKELLKLVSTRMELWSQMLELEEKARDPDRFKNRGGQLLLEEKERKVVPKQLSKIEEKVLHMASLYEIKNGTPFRCWGETIQNIICKNHMEYDQSKKLKLSARKLVTPTNRQIRTPSSSNIKSRGKLFPRHSPTTASSCTYSSSRIPKAPSSKKRSQTSVKENIAGRRPIPKIHWNGKSICKTKISFSTEKKKREDKFRRISKMLKKHRPSTWSEYNDFKTSVPSRSTIVVANGCASPLGVPLPKSPCEPT